MKMFSSNKGMGIGDAPTLILTLVTIGIVGAIGVLIVVGFQSSLTVNSSAYNVTVKIIESVTNFFALAPTLGTVFIGVILLGAVGYFLYKRM